jgi:hypothetical protein
MTSIINSLMEARTTAEVNLVVNENLELFNEHPFLFRYARNARKRICRIAREKKKSWNEHLN